MFVTAVWYYESSIIFFLYVVLYLIGNVEGFLV